MLPRSTIVNKQFRIRSVLILMACIAFVVSVSVRLFRNQPPQWKPYTLASLNEALEQNQPVLISLSANWCMSCFDHERSAINSSDSYQAIRDNGITALRADATNGDPAVMQLMKDNGLISIPAFLLFNPKFPREPLILKDLTSKVQLLDAIRYNAGRSQNKPLDTKPSIDRVDLR